MKSILHPKSLLLTAAACLAFGVASARAQTVTFGFQKGNLTTNSVVLDSGYNVMDGVLGDANATALLTSSQTAAVGSFFKSGSPNGQQNCGFFSYDLTQLASFITANTSGNSSVSIASASYTVIAAGAASTSGGNYAWQLYGTDPFTSSCTWSNYDGVNPWTVPYQNIAAPNNTVQYGYTGGGSALTTSLNTNSIFLNGVSTGNPLTLLGGTNFISAITNALARGDKTLYLTLRIPTFVNGDSRQGLTFSPTNTVASRPLLQIAVNVTVTSGSSTWTGGGGNNSWTTAGNWSPSGVPPANAFINFNNLSTANLSTVLNQDFTVNGINVTNPAGPVSIGGANSLSINSASGIDLSAATQNLTITAPVGLGANQSWNVGASRTLSIGGVVTGSGNLTIAGSGKVLLNAANLLPVGAGVGSLTLSGTLDLNGTAQTINLLTGAGVVDNTAGNAATLTLTNGSNGSFSGTIQNTGGALALAKTGAGTATLSGVNTYGGGTTVNAGNLQPGNANAIGTGILTVNSNGILYPVAGMHITNAVTLNGGTLEIGGGNNNVLSIDGPVTVTADSAIKADGGTYGVYVNGGVNMGSGNYTLSSFNNNSGKGSQLTDITGANGTIMNVAANGTLWIQGTNTFAGIFRATNGPISFLNAYSAQNATLDMDTADSGNVSFGADVILGALTGSRDLNLGIRDISIGNNNANTTYSGAMSNSGSVTKIGTGTLTLSGVNTYSGGTTNAGGTLLINGSVVGDLEVLSGATLGGSGSIGGNVNLQSGATLALTQDNTVTNLSVGGNLSLVGNTVVKLDKSQSPSNDVVNVAGTLSYGGTLTITNVGPSLAVGESFRAFPAGGTGSFTVQGSAGAGKGFLFNDGVISVVSAGPVLTLTAVSPNPVTGSSYAVTLTLTGTGFTPASSVLLTNGATPVSATTAFVNSTTLTASFVPGTTASAAWKATVFDSGNYSSSQTFSVATPSPVSINKNAVNSAGAGKLVLSGTGGTAGNSYAVVSTTNLNPPVVWTPVVTNQFDGLGGFSFTNAVSLTTPKLFLRISE